MFIKSVYSEKAPKAIGPYSVATKLGDFVFVSGQLPVDASTGEIVEGGIEAQTRQSLTNMKSVLASIGLEPRHVVKTTVFIKDMNDFAAMNEVYGEFFSDPFPARSCVEVARLPKDALVEVEAIVIDTLVYEQQLMAQTEGDCSCGSGCSDCGDGGCGCQD